MDALRDEIEDIEEALVESVQDALTDRRKVGAAGRGSVWPLAAAHQG